jgi:hypothetical protein
MEKYNPVEILLKIQKLKYNEAIVPILLILSGFVINFIKPYSFVKYLSLLGFFLYLFITLKYHVKKNIPPVEDNIVLSPVYGLVKKADIETNLLVIKKGFLSPADYRCNSNDEKVEIQVKEGKLTILAEDSCLPGKLIGILPLTALLICKFPQDYLITISPGQKLISGETILAKKKSL